ncbi:UNVERIFIED_CONTAM: hypothetical protein FKN15_032939 [Acipenser sinensis]
MDQSERCERGRKYSTSFCWRGWSGGGPPDILAFSPEVQLSNHYQKEQHIVQTQNLQDSWDRMEGRHSQEGDFNTEEQARVHNEPHGLALSGSWYRGY